ncbi:MAG: DNA repair protein RadC [Muribaculaceae bacterium]|nr:DNA repair protein RadC [Muribaculaceae bacterium]
MSKNQSALERFMPGECLPRERALRDGVKSLTDVELIALLLGSGIKGKNVIELSSEILNEVDQHISYLTMTPLEELLARHSGLGKARAITLLAAIELGQRASTDAEKVASRRVAIKDATTTVNYMRRHFNGLDHEEFWAVMLNRSLKIIREFRVRSGGQTATVVDPKIIIRRMLAAQAHSVILFHNHPSGALKPSPQDIELTKKIKNAAGFFDMNVLDHIIISDEGFYSFCDNGNI